MLGRIVGNICPDPGNIKEAKKFSEPSTVKKRNHSLGMVGYYMRFVEKVTKIDHSLTQITRQNLAKEKATFSWKDE